MSDREKYGLRGLVKTCVELPPYAGAIAGAGTQISEQKSRYTTEYDLDGNILATRFGNTDGSEFATRNTYDASGRKLKSAWGNAES